MKNDEVAAFEAFEKRVFHEYVKPGPALVEKVMQDSIDFAGDTLNPQEVFAVEIPIAAQKRQVTLALQEYHKALSHALKEVGVTLPDFVSLISALPEK